MADRHPQLVEADKQLQIAKDAYRSVIENIDRQYVKPLVGALGEDSPETAAMRASYYAFTDEAVLNPAPGETVPAATPKARAQAQGRQAVTARGRARLWKTRRRRHHHERKDLQVRAAE